PIMTVALPLTMESGGPTQTQRLPTLAAGVPPIITVGAPGPVIGPPTWGIGGVPGVCIGQVCMSVRRAAGGISVHSFTTAAAGQIEALGQIALIALVGIERIGQYRRQTDRAGHRLRIQERGRRDFRLTGFGHAAAAPPRRG